MLANNGLFDKIRHCSDSGEEYWLARELMTALGYTRWDRFKHIIERAKVACVNSGSNASDHFIAVKKNNTGSKDYFLTHYACYLVAMNGDPHKTAIAEAQSYFAVRTRRTELDEGLSEESEEIQQLRLTNENYRLQIELFKLDSAMIAMHGKEVVLALRGLEEQFVKGDTITIVEVVDREKECTNAIIPNDELKRIVKERTGRKLISAKWFADRLIAAGRDDLLVSVRRTTTQQYVPPQHLDEAIAIVYGSSSNFLMGS